VEQGSGLLFILLVFVFIFGFLIRSLKIFAGVINKQRKRMDTVK
jgi:hypothetical protein